VCLVCSVCETGASDPSFRLRIVGVESKLGPLGTAAIYCVLLCLPLVIVRMENYSVE
jgi:hypothetical protein